MLVLIAGIPPDNLNGDHLQIYPNPAKDIINININHPEYLNSVVEIFNAEGKLVRKILVNDPVVILEVSELPHGLFICKLKLFNEIIESGKFIIK